LSHIEKQESISHRTIVKTFLVILFIYAVTNFIGNFYKLVINTDHSLPQRLFIVNLQDREPSKGDYVVFYFKGSEYYKAGHKMIKKVVCLPGEELYVDEQKRYFCNGIYLGTAKATDSRGKPVDNFKWNGKIPDGNYFVMGVSKDSYDSRYWGFLDKEAVIGVAKPLF